MSKPGLTIGPYRLFELLGRGGMGVVYRAVGPDGVSVALKTVRMASEDSLQLLRREIRALARLRHPQVVRILDHGVQDGLPWYSMELLSGTSLRHYASQLHAPGEAPAPESADSDSVTPVTNTSDQETNSMAWWTNTIQTAANPLASHPSVPIRAAEPVARPIAAGGRLTEVLDLVRRMCAPLAYLHGEGLVHRDLKLDNILLRSEQQDGRSEKREARSEESKATRTERQADSEIPATDPTPSSLTPHSSFLTPPSPSSLTPHSSFLTPPSPSSLTPHSSFLTPPSPSSLPSPSSFLTPSSFAPVVVDFGLIARFSAQSSREVLEVGASSAGSVHTIAPEQILGQLVDARADLYALGCILYELLTGKPPFQGLTHMAIVRAHLGLEPVPPSERVEGISPQLDALVLRLLAKQPRDRFGHADDLASELEWLGARSFVPEGAPAPRAYLYRPGLAGREPVLDRLRPLLTAARESRGSLALLGGESGIGKTRLVLELSLEAERAGLRVLAAECLPASAAAHAEDLASAPLQPLRVVLRAIADRCRERGAPETEQLLGRRGAVLSLFEPSLLGLPGQSAQPPPESLPTEEARQRLFALLGDTLVEFARTQPLLLAFDDLQWADELTLSFLAHFQESQRLSSAPLLLVGTYRSEEVRTQLQQLSGTQALHIPLGRLDEPAVASMIAEMLAVHPAPPIFARHLAHHSEGNPFFVAEYLRSALEQSLLFRDPRGHWQVVTPPEGDADMELVYRSLPLPRSLRELVGRRLDNLSAPARRLAEAAAVLGREIDEALLASMLTLLDLGTLFEPLDELLARQILEEADLGKLRFLHDKIRETLYAELPRDRRWILHRAAAQTIEAQPPSRRQLLLPALGGHWEAAGAPERARIVYLEAARQSRYQYSSSEAERLYRTVLRLTLQPDVHSVSARNELGEFVLQPQGRIPEAQAEYQLALQQARELGDRDTESDSLGCLGVLLWRSGQLELARDLANQALTLFRDLGKRRREGWILTRLANLDQEQGRLDAALELYAQALQIQRALNDHSGVAWTLTYTANVHAFLGRLEEATSLYQQALALHRQVGDRQGEGNTLGGLASNVLRQNRLDEARELFQQTLAINRESQARLNEAWTLSQLGDVCRLQGRVEQAESLYEESIQLLRQVRYRQIEAWTLADLAGLARLVRGDFDKAAGLLAQSQTVMHELGDDIGEATIECGLGALALARGQSALPHLRSAQQRAKQLKAGPESDLGKEITKLQAAQTAFQAGQHERLFRGDLIEAIPEGLKRWLANAGLLPPPSPPAKPKRKPRPRTT